MKYATLLFLFALGGCSTVSDWFGPSKAVTKPAELTEFKQLASLTRMWEAQTGKASSHVFTPATDGQAVYVASAEGRISRLDLATGKTTWQIEAGQPISGGVGVGDGLVLVGTIKGVLLAYKAADGSPAWNAKLGGEILSPAVAGEGVVAARGNDGKVWMVESATGKVRWVQSRALPALTLREQGHMILTHNALYAGMPGGRLVAFALNNGAPVWEGSVALPKGATELERIVDVNGTLTLDEQRVCAASYQGRVACFNRISGSPLWAREISTLRGVDGDESFVFAVDEHDMVYAYTKGRGVNPWKQDKLRDRKLSSPLAVAGKYVAVGDYQGHVHLLTAEDGAFVARVSTDGSPIQGVMIPLKSGLVVQTANGGVYAFKIQ
ncbi:MAG: outer membrane protein assembly factor BamB [Betaproteobacteria bacterium]|nr:outer membrane protein assembly factor BamB [Betaproteobacteria bacterium]